MTKHRTDVYTRITAEIVAAIETGAGDWKMPWHHDGGATARPINLRSGRRYRGVNVLVLWIAAQATGYGTGLWGTYRQWLAAGAQVRKGERGTVVVLWKEIARKDAAEEDREDDSHRPRFFARSFRVFNLAQVDGYAPEAAAALPESARFSQAEAFIDALKIPATFGAYHAHYRLDLDHIFMPPFQAFDDAAGFYGTHLHECAHATAAEHRLDRTFDQRFRRDACAMEEVTAELTASFVLADLGIAHHPRLDHAAYLASWLRILKDDPRAIFTAAGKAQAAADWMHRCQPGSKVEDPRQEAA
jgi:antirestriction protein ArdC